MKKAEIEIKMEEQKTKPKEKEEKTSENKEMASTKESIKQLTQECTDKKCPFHGILSVRGRIFKGEVKKIVQNRAVIEWERIVFHPKYERYSKKKSRIHARIPQCIIPKIKVGSVVKAGECRPLSKMVHFVVLEILK